MVHNSTISLDPETDDNIRKILSEKILKIVGAQLDFAEVDMTEVD